LRTIFLAAALAAAECARACATCSGPADDPQSIGLNAAILTLLGVSLAVFVTALGFIGVMAWRMARHEASAAAEAAAKTATAEAGP